MYINNPIHVNIFIPTVTMEIASNTRYLDLIEPVRTLALAILKNEFLPVQILESYSKILGILKATLKGTDRLIWRTVHG